MSEFFDSFNVALPEMEAAFTEDWTLGNSTYPAISMDRETVTSKAMSGGKFVDAQSMLFVRLDIFLQSGVKKGDIITARGDQFIVKEIDQDGDDARTLLLGPSQIDVWA
jgi:hypothetical protein